MVSSDWTNFLFFFHRLYYFGYIFLLKGSFFFKLFVFFPFLIFLSSIILFNVFIFLLSSSPFFILHLLNVALPNFHTVLLFLYSYIFFYYIYHVFPFHLWNLLFVLQITSFCQDDLTYSFFNPLFLLISCIVFLSLFKCVFFHKFHQVLGFIFHHLIFISCHMFCCCSFLSLILFHVLYNFLCFNLFLLFVLFANN